MIDEPDAHLEILRQKQVYVLLREIAHKNQSQVILATHSEVILDEALDNNLILLLEGKADNLSEKKNVKTVLKQYGAPHYLKARERGYVVYVEGGTDIDILRALAQKLEHPVAHLWDERINSYYVQNNFPDPSFDNALERVEGGFGATPKDHFRGLKQILPNLNGLALLDNDGKNPVDVDENGLSVRYWAKYEVENYFVTPELLERYALSEYNDMDLFNSFRPAVREVLDDLILTFVFGGVRSDFETFQKATKDVSQLVWNSKTERLKLSRFAEDFFRKLNEKTHLPMLLRKGTLHHLIPFCDAKNISHEVTEKLDLLKNLFETATQCSKEETL